MEADYQIHRRLSGHSGRETSTGFTGGCLDTAGEKHPQDSQEAVWTQRERNISFLCWGSNSDVSV
jgi:hypothetical protein